MRLKDEKFYKTVRDFLDIYLIKHRGYSLISFRSVSMSASAVQSSRKLPHSVRRKKRPELMPPTM